MNSLQTLNLTILQIVTAMEGRAPHTLGHTKRVSDIAGTLGEKFDFQGEQKEILIRSALMHDIGKIGLSDSILRKTGILDEYEWKAMKLHPEFGVKILSPVGAHKELLPLILHHHEAWNGKGYPAGLSKTDIPFESRILAVADTYDALTNHRPFRKKFSHQVAVEKIKSQSGKMFDPEVVEAFLDLPFDGKQFSVC